MKKRLKEIEEEAGALREMQAKVEKEMGSVQGLCLNLAVFTLCPYPNVVFSVMSLLYLSLFRLFLWKVHQSNLGFALMFIKRTFCTKMKLSECDNR